MLRFSALLLWVLLPAALWAQDSGKRYTLSLRQLSYAQAMDTLARVAGLNFIYSDDYLPQHRRVSLQLKGQPIDDALKVLFDGRFLSYVHAEGDVLVQVVNPPLDSRAVLRLPRYALSGRLVDAHSGEPVVGATVFVKETYTGVAADERGYYVMTLPKGDYTLVYSSIGYRRRQQQVSLQAPLVVDQRLAPDSVQLREVVLYSAAAAGEEEVNLRRMESALRVNPQFFKETPTVLGEPDMVRALQTLPGVQSGNDGAAGFFVRGGASDQNMILMDGTPIYNASHFLGYYSVFLPELVANAELYKSGIPARYGGRTASVLDVQLREGNREKHEFTGGIGTFIARASAEGPLGKSGNASYVVGGRRTYWDMLYAGLRPDGFRGNSMYFFDLNAKVNLRLGQQHRLTVGTYSGQDRIGYQESLSSSWGNHSITARWDAVLGPRLTQSLSYSIGNFTASTAQNTIPEQGYYSYYRLFEHNLDYHLAYYLSPRTELEAGLRMSYHRYLFGDVEPFSNLSEVDPSEAVPSKNAESAFYLSLQHSLSPRLTVRAGLRYSRLDVFRREREYSYISDQVMHPSSSEEWIADTLFYRGTKVVKTYDALEPRLSVNYLLSDRHALRLAYDKTAQYVHQLSSSSMPMASDIWAPVNRYIRPMHAHQVSLGYTHNYADNGYLTGVDLYYRHQRGVLEYKPSASLQVNDHPETEVLQGMGYSYGAEFLAQKRKGRWTGWASYTLGWAQRRIDGINQSRMFPASYDRRHQFTFMAQLKVGERMRLTAQWQFASGMAYSFPSGKYEFDGHIVPLYTDRNAFRLPAVHHLDLSFHIYRKPDPSKKNQSSFNFSVYNAYGRKNAYAYIFRQSKYDPAAMEVVKLYLFSILPSFSYNFRF